MKFLTLIGVVAIAACSPAAQPAAVPSFGSFTPGPSTAAPSPTPTKAPLLGDAVAAALRASGLQISEPTVYTAETDPNKLLGRPGQYTGKVNWKFPPTVAVTRDEATIEVFPDAATMQARYSYLDGIIKSSPLFLQWMYRNDARLAILRLPKELTPDQAKSWEDWFKRI